MPFYVIYGLDLETCKYFKQTHQTIWFSYLPLFGHIIVTRFVKLWAHFRLTSIQFPVYFWSISDQLVPLGYPGWQSECVVSFIDPATKTLWDHTGDISVLNSLNKLIKSKSLLDLSLDYRDQKCPQRSDSCSFTYIQKGTQFQIRWQNWPKIICL